MKMRAPLQNGVAVLTLILIPILVSGCLAASVNLVDNQTVSLERIPTKYFYISWARVYQQEDEIEVHGQIRRRYRLRRDYGGHGHIDVAVVAPDGIALEEVSTLYYPRDIPRKSAPVAYFTVRLSQPPPPGSTVRLSYHKDGHSIRREFNCDKNAALPRIKETEEE
jgi:hypothetical protein